MICRNQKRPIRKRTTLPGFKNSVPFDLFSLILFCCILIILHLLYFDGCVKISSKYVILQLPAIYPFLQLFRESVCFHFVV